MIRVAVGQHERVERAHAEGAQRARDDALADVEGRTVGGILEWSGWKSARIDEEGATIREHEQRRIALPHIQKDDT